MPELADFSGQWALSRQVELAGGAWARFEGRAAFVPAGPGRLAYREEGLLSPPGAVAPLRAERSYLWCAEGDEIAVFFDDGRPFHRFCAARPEASHWCDPDQYDVRYDFTLWPEWHSAWQVRGPRKEYRLTSQFRRAG